MHTSLILLYRIMKYLHKYAIRTNNDILAQV
nr:MAG TPA: hypothetical protein [Caudoviricetes sp.]DAR16824.1 MAG TPA: hypothetical protein [Caudoviricetes sp.]